MDRNTLVLFGGIGFSLGGLMALNGFSLELAFKANLISNFEMALDLFIMLLFGVFGVFCVKSLIDKEKSDD